MKEQAIGIIDSGIGGFTVAKSIRKALPHEDILYLGDGANAPYGNRSSEELTALAKYMVQFMNQQRVKLLLVACNTISCLADSYQEDIACPVLYVVKSGAKGVATLDVEKIAVISTLFTHEKQMYAKYIHEISPEKQVYSGGSRHLVGLIENNRGDKESAEGIKEEIRQVLTPLVAEGAECCVLGCTHYPLAMEELTTCFPTLPFSDPATEMAKEATTLLSDNNLLNSRGGTLTVYTTGDPILQEAHLERAGLLPVGAILHLPPLVL